MWIFAVFLLFAVIVNGDRNDEYCVTVNYSFLSGSLSALDFFSMWIFAAFLLFAVIVNGDRNDEPFGRRQRCPSGWEKFETTCYKFFSDSKTWAEAERWCVGLEGNLASVHSRATHDFLTALAKRRSSGAPRVWIGACDAAQNNIWLWSDGSKFDYSNWQTGQPNNAGGTEACTEMTNGAELRWNDAVCSAQRNFICQNKL
ncbi:hypothetical protein Q8A67_002923 [Cirrhinus molitorella]|uniref:C-type lectin domain-containing protein n=1 Tax=Cirrhinus molitorella TaxID=172907 RepID=A0AA88PZQ4_9TELE|nr:hypothetical protein Q8A67_002923 [Cirrhinus molitorella]